MQTGVVEMVEFEDLNDLAEIVEESGNLAVCQMRQLRDAVGWDRLTTRAIDEIENQLAGRGLGAFPQPLPDARRAEVRIYKRGSKLGQIVEAVTEPSEHRDELLRQLANRDSDRILEDVRRLVGA